VNAKITRKLASIPAAPGVYLMKDAGGAVIYVGKAVSLRSRVRSYFRSSSAPGTRPAERHIASRAADVEFIVTSNENEAFILENNLIKKFKPRYNIRLRDDKTFLSLKVDLEHPFPSIVPVRRPRRDGAVYFGPYTSSSAIRSTLRFLRTVAPFRVCSDREFRNRARPCIQYHIKRCSGPCCGLIGSKDYRADLEVALRVLRGEVDELQDELRIRMQSAAAGMQYEEAARLRDRIKNLEHFAATQKVQVVRFDDADVLGFHSEGGIAEVVVLFFRDGKLVSSSPFSFDVELEADEVLSQFVLRYYGERRHVPREIFLPFAIPDMAEVGAFLKSRRQGAVSVKVPRRGDALKLAAMAGENARLSLRASRGVKEIAAGIAESLRQSLGLRKAPIRIESIDISNTGGGEAVGAVVHFKEGEPLKSRYRRFRVKTVAGVDDYAMMREVVARRLRRGSAEENLPDLILIDGGVGHVTAAVRAAAEAGVPGIDIAGIAKGENRKSDRVFRPGAREPVALERGSGEFHLLQRVRDEAHRFAVAYHRKLRGKRSLASPLDGVPGLGRDRKEKVLGRFGGLRGLKGASLEEIMKVDGVGPVLARRILEAVRGWKPAVRGWKPAVRGAKPAVRGAKPAVRGAKPAVRTPKRNSGSGE